MPGGARLGDFDSGHGTYTPDVITAASPNVLINGIPAARTGDAHGVHVNTVKPFDAHAAFCGAGSATVLINGIPAFKIGDSVDAATQIGGSGNVIIGG